MTAHTPDPPNDTSQAGPAQRGQQEMSQWTAMMASPEQKAPMEINGTVKRGREADPEPDTGRRQTKSQKPGKGRGKPSRRQEDNASSNRFPGDQEPKNLCKLVNLIAQLSLRQEDQLAYGAKTTLMWSSYAQTPRSRRCHNWSQMAGEAIGSSRIARPAAPSCPAELPPQCPSDTCGGATAEPAQAQRGAGTDARHGGPQLKLRELRHVQPQASSGESSNPHPPATNGRSSELCKTWRFFYRERNPETLREHAGGTLCF